MSNSNMLKYISILMHDDEALKRYIADPITDPEEKHGLTKAERAVMRRVVANLSNNSANGYSLERELSSYRKSLRLMQNVLHNVGTKMFHHIQSTDVETQKQNSQKSHPYSLVVYLPPSPGDYSRLNNSQLPPPYTNPKLYSVNLPNATADIGALLDQVQRLNSNFSFTVEKRPNGEFVDSFNIDSNKYFAALPTSKTTDYGFWFYSVNGRANPQTAGSVPFREFAIESGSTTIWQLIAPDEKYGFSRCDVHPANVFGQNKKRLNATQSVD